MSLRHLNALTSAAAEVRRISSRMRCLFMFASLRDGAALSRLSALMHGLPGFALKSMQQVAITESFRLQNLVQGKL